MFDIELKEITKRYNSLIAISNLSLTVKEGELMVLIGPSGCGKTTLLKIIAGVEIPNEGKVYIRGKDITSYPPQKRNVTMLWQSLALFPHLNVERNVGFGLLMRKVSNRELRKKVVNVLDLVGLSQCNKRTIQSLSGGEKQRVALARALAPEPHILLLDEPFGSVDFNTSLKLQSEISRIHEKLKVTFLLVTHNRTEALSLAGRIAVMHNGKIEQIGTPTEIIYQPATRFVASFVGNNNILEGSVELVQGKEIGVKTSLGVFYGYLSDSIVNIPSRGAEVAYVVPYHKVFISLKKELINKISGRCVGRQVIGAIVSYLIELKNGTVFTVERHLSDEKAEIDLKYGDILELSWTVDDAIIIH